MDQVNQQKKNRMSNQMTNQGSKFLKEQVKKLRDSLERLLKVNEEFQAISATLNADLKALKDERVLLIDQSVFKALRQFILLRRKNKKS